LFAVVALSFALAGIVCFVLGLIVASRRLGVPFDALIMTTVAVLVAVTGWATFLAWMLFFGIPVDIGSVLFGAVSLAIGLWQAYPHRRLLVDAWHEIVERLRREQLLWAGVALLLVVQVSRTVHTLREIGDFGYDSASYHLPIAANIIQNGSLFGAENLVPWMWYPALVEVQAAFLGLLSGSVKVASLVQIGYWVWIAVFVAAVVASYGNRVLGFASAVAVAAIPTMWLQARVAYVDVAFAALFAVSAFLVVVAFQHRNDFLVLLAALTSGALVAIKLVPFAAIPLTLGAFAVALGSKHRLRMGTLVVIIGVLPAVPFYARTQIEQGIPFYPVDLRIAEGEVTEWPRSVPYAINEMRWIVDEHQVPDDYEGMTRVERLVHSYVVSPVEEALVGYTDSVEPSEPWLTYRYDSRVGGFGAAWLLLIIAGAIGGIVALAKIRRWPNRDSVAVLLGGMTLLTLLAFLLSQTNWWPRFTLGMAVVAAIVASVLVSKVRWMSGLVALVAVMLAVNTVGLAEKGGGVESFESAEPQEGFAIARTYGLNPLTAPYLPLLARESHSVVLTETLAIPTLGLYEYDWQRDVSVARSRTELGDDIACVDAVLAYAPSKTEAATLASEFLHAPAAELEEWSDGSSRTVWWVFAQTPCTTAPE
jgi:4-amino-4-deoxy-L-arabinose transferase-like glycosyltransferase